MNFYNSIYTVIQLKWNPKSKLAQLEISTYLDHHNWSTIVAIDSNYE